MLPIVLFFIVLTTYIYCIIHCLRNHALEYNSRLLWVIIIFLIPFFGGILYLTMGKNGDESRRQF